MMVIFCIKWRGTIFLPDVRGREEADDLKERVRKGRVTGIMHA